MSTPAPRPDDDAFPTYRPIDGPTYRSDAGDRDRARRRVRQVTALLGVGAAVGTGAFTVGMALGSTPATSTATVAATTTAPASTPAPATLTRFVSDDGDDGGWQRVVTSTPQSTQQGTQQAPTSGSLGSATTSGGSTAVTVP